LVDYSEDIRFRQLEVVGKADLQGFIKAGSCALLFLSMTLPTVPKLVVLKSCLFALLLAGIGLSFLAGTRARLDLRIALWTLALTAVSLVFVMKGIVAGNPGAAEAVTVYILWPITFTVWIARLSDDDILSALHRTMIAASFFIGVYGCFYLLTQLEIVPDIGLVSAFSFGWDAQAFGAHQGYTQMAIAGMNSLPFLVPYVMASAAIQSLWTGPGAFWKFSLWAACALGWLTILAGGRRALFLVVLLTPPLIFLATLFLPPGEKRAGKRRVMKFTAVLTFAIAVIFVGLALIYEVDRQAIWEQFTSGFDLSAQTPDADALERRQQLLALSRGWLERPLFGAGMGASVLGSIRSENTPWAYELYYLALLYQTGLAGFLAYAAGVMWIFWRGLAIIREGGREAQLMIPMLVGLSGLLIANATNPYLGKFDEMWTLFLPLAVINRRLLRA
jgi:O-antigen ligase